METIPTQSNVTIAQEAQAMEFNFNMESKTKSTPYWTQREKALIKKGSSHQLKLGDLFVDFDTQFALFMTSRLANPRFSPELSAKCIVIDFTVTMIGLE